MAAKEDALVEAKRNYGYFCLLRNEIKDSAEALAVYRNEVLSIKICVFVLINNFILILSFLS